MRRGECFPHDSQNQPKSDFALPGQKKPLIQAHRSVFSRQGDLYDLGKTGFANKSFCNML